MPIHAESKKQIRERAQSASEARAQPVAKAERRWWLYLIECRGAKLYAGISPDVDARFAAHCAGVGARFTRANPPVRIVAAESHGSRSAASTAEYRLKRMSRDEKLEWAQTRRWRETNEQGT